MAGCILVHATPITTVSTEYIVVLIDGVDPVGFNLIPGALFLFSGGIHLRQTLFMLVRTVRTNHRQLIHSPTIAYSQYICVYAFILHESR